MEVLGEASAQQNPGEEVTVREAMELGEPVMRVKLKDQPELLGVVLATIGRVYGQMSLYDEARTRLEEAIDLMGPANSRDLSGAEVDLGMVEFQQFNLAEAEKHLLKALAIITDILGEKNLESASVLRWLGIMRMPKVIVIKLWLPGPRIQDYWSDFLFPITKRKKQPIMGWIRIFTHTLGYAT